MRTISVLSRRGTASLCTAATAVALSLVVAPPAHAATVTSASFSGGAGTATVGGVLFAKQGAALTLTVNTSSDTKCVDVAGALAAHQQSATARSTWTFSLAGAAGNGAQSVTVTASPNFNPQDKCTGNSGSGSASYTADNTGPTVTGALSPAPNAAGWNRADVAIAWSATDAGSGVSGTPTPASDSVTTSTAGVTKSASAQDRVGNAATGQVTVKLDKTAPTISGSRNPAANAEGWNNTNVSVSFLCDDLLAGIKTCPSGSTIGTEGADQSVAGTATDNADNTASTTVSGISIDKTAPSLSGAPTTAPNANGWYSNDVTIDWSATDALSGLAGSVPADSVIGGEGSSLTATASVSDKAGNTRSASSVSVQIDRTAPVTTLTGTVNQWTDDDEVTVSLTPADALSGVEGTTYTVDGGAPQTGTTVTLSSEGDHTLTWSSTDKAGNVEDEQTAHVQIDRSAPSISAVFAPVAAALGWVNETATVGFDCGDDLSGVATCSDPTTVSDEGSTAVTGHATDAAGNSASTSATVRVDKTAPELTGAPDRDPNPAGWYDADVTVTWTATDALSGVATVSDPVVISQGANQTATGSATDAAGNSATAEVKGLNVDKTAPELTPDYEGGWHQGDVTVDWLCTDALSGIVGPDHVLDTVTGEGDALTSSASCSDVAGNEGTGTVSDIKIDRTAPATTATVPDPLPSGWYAGPVEVTLGGSDALSGVDKTLYTVDGGDPQEYDGPFDFTQKGEHTLSFWSVDVAGNREDAEGNTLTLKIDGIAPKTTLLDLTTPERWYNHGIPVAFTVEENESGVAATYFTVDGGEKQTYGEPFTFDLDTGVYTLRYWSEDVAGNVEDAHEYLLKLDKTPPSITGHQEQAANGFGWNNTDVDVYFTCTDADSGLDDVVGCAGDTTLTNEGAGQEVVGDALDVAGNTSKVTYGPVNIDKTVPTLSGVPQDPNAAGWYRGDVKVTWTGDDALSGIDPSSQPEDSTVVGEGRGLGAGATIKDKAGNQGSGSVSGLKIDRTAPSVTGRTTSQPNAAGWFSGEVSVDWTCTDPDLADGTAGSDVATCPTTSLAKGDGAAQSVTSGKPTDLAGNEGATASVDGINIDGTAPATTADNQCTRTNGWCTGGTANVVLSANDNLSGVKAIHYRVDGGAEHVSPGNTATVAVPLDGSGAGTIEYWAVDNADNAENHNSESLKWDNIAPTVTHTLSPVPNADGWNRADVTVTFAAKDDDKGSGVDQSTLSQPVTVTDETSGRVVTGTAKDTAGNQGTDAVTVKLDKTAPTITGQVTAGTLGDNGWYVGAVTVSFTCADALSGIPDKGCPDPVVLTANGSGNEAGGTVTDRAGNSATATVGGIKIDQERPTLTPADVNVAGGKYVLGAVPTPRCLPTVTDSFSGLVSCTVTVTGGNTNGVGTFTWTATAKDAAGNSTTIQGTFQVVYRFDGFLQPINDTAHQVATSTSVFKAGSTVPVKLQLKAADGKIVTPTSAPAWLTPVKGSATSAPVDESLYSASGDSGTTYRSDGQQWIHNWKTGSAGGSYWRIGVKLDDGETYFVNIGLR